MARHDVAQIDLFLVTIDGDNYERNNLTMYGDASSGKFTVSQDFTTVLNEVLYSDLYADGATVAFASYADAYAWFSAHVLFAAVTVQESLFNQVLIDGQEYKRYGIALFFDEERQKIKAVQDGDTLFDTLFSNLYDSGNNIGFTTYSDAVEWINRHLRFNGYCLDARKPEQLYFFLNGKPYYKNELFRVWDDNTLSLELRHGPGDLSNKPMPMTSYKNIVINNADDAIVSYEALITWVAENTLK